MKIKNSRLVFFICSVMLLFYLLGLTACTTPRSYYQYTEAAFSARVEGHLNQTATQAKIAAVPTDEGFFVEVEYLAPESLSGLSLTGSCNRQGEPIGEISYRFCNQNGNVDATLCGNLLLPITTMLTPREPMRVERNEEGYLLSFSEDGLLQLNKSSVPTHIRTNTVDFWVVWWDFQVK